MYQNGVLNKNEVQNVLLDLLSEFDDFCRSRNLTYSLSNGTLLGAVRHKGFIPWDDDVDVYMPRPDYDRFISEYSKEGNLKRYRIVNWANSPFPFPFAKFCDLHYKAITYQYADLATEYLWMDIFPLDGTPDNPGNLQKYLFFRDVRLKLAYCYTMKSESRLKQLARNTVKKTTGFFVNPQAILRSIDKNARRISFSQADFVAPMAWNCYGVKEVFPRDYFNELVELEFEEHRFLAVKEWDEMLTSIYGNYMQLPPADKRVDHGIEAMRVQ